MGMEKDWRDHYPNYFWQIREALIIEIKDAQRWCAIEGAFLALKKVIRLGENMRKESRHLAGLDTDTQGDIST